jgi:hypothetical protein
MPPDHPGERRIGVWLSEECIAWLDKTAERDQSTRSDLLDGLVLLAMDGELEAAWKRVRQLERRA